MVFDSIYKTKWKRKKTHLLTTNGSTKHDNLLVIVASHVSLDITGPWFKSVSKHDPNVNSTHPNSIKQEQATLKPSKLNKSKYWVK